MYEAREGMVRSPVVSDAVTGVPGDLAGGDDDGDGSIDEDRLDGRDNDGDGSIDEDFAQLGSQMYSCIIRDDDAISEQLFPDHRPLNLEIYQEACAWDQPGSEDIVGLRWVIKNVGVQTIHDVYVGLLIDGDIGRHSDPDAGTDDLAGVFEGLVRQPERYFEDFQYVWMRDADALDALPGWLGATLDGSGFGDRWAVRPDKYGVHALRILSMDHMQESGGLPFLDHDRYELLSRPGRDRDIAEHRPSDYAVLMSVGPYSRLEPGEHVVVEAALTVALSELELKWAMRRANDLAAGRWYNGDGLYASGGGGAETLICAEDLGLPWDRRGHPLYWRFPAYWNEECKPSGMGAGFPIEPEDLTWYPELGKHCIWLSTDNCEECERYYGRECNRDNPGGAPCYSGSARARGACTGQFGRESRIPWSVRSALPPPPLLRVEPTANGMDVFWDDRSQREPDPFNGRHDFEAYRVWRADNWTRPAGTSAATGPPVVDWSLIAEFDLMNFFPPDEDEIQRPFGQNTGLESIAYRPVCLDDPRFEGLAAAMTEVVHADTTGELEELPPLRDYSGLPVPGLEGLLRWEGYPAELDTFFAVTERPAEVGVPKEAIRYYSYHDRDLHNGFVYFYAVTATEHVPASDGSGIVAMGGGALPSGGFVMGVPRAEAADPDRPETMGREIYAYPNPATREALAEFQAMEPNADDPTGVRISFVNLPACRNTINIFTLAGDLVQTIDHDGTGGDGQAYWNMVSRNGQEVVSGIYLYLVRPEDGRFEHTIGKFVIIR